MGWGVKINNLRSRGRGKRGREEGEISEKTKKEKEETKRKIPLRNES